MRPLMRQKFRLFTRMAMHWPLITWTPISFGLFWQPSAYLDFAMPVKVFEALGYGVPLVTTAGTTRALCGQ